MKIVIFCIFIFSLSVNAKLYVRSDRGEVSALITSEEDSLTGTKNVLTLETCYNTLGYSYGEKVPLWNCEGKEIIEMPLEKFKSIITKHLTDEYDIASIYPLIKHKDLKTLLQVGMKGNRGDEDNYSIASFGKMKAKAYSKMKKNKQLTEMNELIIGAFCRHGKLIEGNERPHLCGLFLDKKENKKDAVYRGFKRLFKRLKEALHTLFRSDSSAQAYQCKISLEGDKEIESTVIANNTKDAEKLALKNLKIESISCSPENFSRKKVFAKNINNSNRDSNKELTINTQRKNQVQKSATKQ